MHTNSFYMQFYITYARKDPKENMLVQNTYLAFSYFSALEIPPRLTTCLIKRKFQCNSQFCKHRRYIEGTAYIKIDKNIQIQDFRTLVLL